jgi:hypothetical protein
MRVIVDPDGACDMEPVGNVATIDDRSKKSLKKVGTPLSVHGGN